MLTEAEKIEFERWRGINSKIAFQKLGDIYMKYTGEQIRNCGCKSQVRQNYLNTFYAWFEANT